LESCASKWDRIAVVLESNARPMSSKCNHRFNAYVYICVLSREAEPGRSWTDDTTPCF
jgi:hypothetical protein